VIGTCAVTLVVAVAENGVIGRDGSLPWRLPSDLRHFRTLTLGKPVVMGRKTFHSIGKPLPGRDTIVVSRSGTTPAAEGRSAVPADTSLHGAASVLKALELGCRLASARGVDEIMVAGGGEIYALALPYADRVHLTRVHARPAGDAYFPSLDPVTWREVAREEHAPGPGDDHAWTALFLERTGDDGAR
jgi:dihydrofolate reductase